MKARKKELKKNKSFFLKKLLNLLKIDFSAKKLRRRDSKKDSKTMKSFMNFILPKLLLARVLILKIIITLKNLQSRDLRPSISQNQDKNHSTRPTLI